MEAISQDGTCTGPKPVLPFPEPQDSIVDLFF